MFRQSWRCWGCWRVLANESTHVVATSKMWPSHKDFNGNWTNFCSQFIVWKKTKRIGLTLANSLTAFTDYCPDRFFGATRSLFLVFLIFFVSVPCVRLGWPSRQLLSARVNILYRIVSYRICCGWAITLLYINIGSRACSLVVDEWRFSFTDCYRLEEPIMKILYEAYTRSVITPPKLNRFGWNLEQCEHMELTLADFGAIRAVATVWLSVWGTWQ